MFDGGIDGVGLTQKRRVEVQEMIFMYVVQPLKNSPTLPPALLMIK